MLEHTQCIRDSVNMLCLDLQLVLTLTELCWQDSRYISRMHLLFTDYVYQCRCYHLVQIFLVSTCLPFLAM